MLPPPGCVLISPLCVHTCPVPRISHFPLVCIPSTLGVNWFNSSTVRQSRRCRQTRGGGSAWQRGGGSKGQQGVWLGGAFAAWGSRAACEASGACPGALGWRRAAHAPRVAGRAGGGGWSGASAARRVQPLPDGLATRCVTLGARPNAVQLGPRQLARTRPVPAPDKPLARPASHIPAISNTHTTPNSRPLRLPAPSKPSTPRLPHTTTNMRAALLLLALVAGASMCAALPSNKRLLRSRCAPAAGVRRRRERHRVAAASPMHVLGLPPALTPALVPPPATAGVRCRRRIRRPPSPSKPSG